MGWSFRRSKQIFPGVRLNVSKKGIGFSYGSKYGRITHSADGKKTFYSSIPGTGLRYRKSLSSNSPDMQSSDDYQSKIERNQQIVQGKTFKGLYFVLVFLWALMTVGTLAALLMPPSKGDAPKSDLIPILFVEMLVFMLIVYYFKVMRKRTMVESIRSGDYYYQAIKRQYPYRPCIHLSNFIFNSRFCCIFKPSLKVRFRKYSMGYLVNFYNRFCCRTDSGRE
jgi:hypothetical protein